MAENRAQRDEPLRALILTDGKMGDLAQCRGIADALQAHSTEVTVHAGKLSQLLGLAAHDRAFKAKMANLPDGQDVIIASGRRTAPYLRLAALLLEPRPLTVFLKDPRTGKGTADLIWVPTHDRLRGDNVIVTDTAPHGHSSERRRVAGAKLQNRLAAMDMPKPWLGVLLGGRTSKVTYSPATIARLTDNLALTAKEAGSVLVTPSRRTPAQLLSALQGIHPNLWVWDGVGDNPYSGMLGACDAFLVTGDSHNMVSEALSTGRQVMVFRPDGLPTKFERFLDQMETATAITAPAATSYLHHQEPIDATAEIAAAIRQKLQNTLR